MGAHTFSKLLHANSLAGGAGSGKGRWSTLRNRSGREDTEDSHRAFGFKRMTTAMAIFENQALAFERGCLSES